MCHAYQLSSYNQANLIFLRSFSLSQHKCYQSLSRERVRVFCDKLEIIFFPNIEKSSSLFAVPHPSLQSLDLKPLKLANMVDQTRECNFSKKGKKITACQTRCPTHHFCRLIIVLSLELTPRALLKREYTGWDSLM